MLKNRKGFTIPELIIVISFFVVVFAIVVPTLISLNKKVEIRDDVVLATLLNEAIVSYMEEEKVESFESFDQFLLALETKGYGFKELEATNEGCYFVWESDTNQVLLVEKKNTRYKVLYNAKEDYGKQDESWHFNVLQAE